MGAAAAGEDEDAGVGPFQSLQVGLELPFGLRMVQALGILRKAPVRGVFVDVRPAETISAVRRIPEIIDFVPGLPEAGHHFGEISVPPAGSDVDPGHGRPLFLIALVRDDRLAVGVEERREAAAVAAADIQVIDTGFLVDDDDGIAHQAEAFFFLDIESVFSHGRVVKFSNIIISL